MKEMTPVANLVECVPHIKAEFLLRPSGFKSAPGPFLVTIQIKQKLQKKKKTCAELKNTVKRVASF